MKKIFRKMVRSWGTTSQLDWSHFLWIVVMFGILGALETNRIGLFLIPPFGATLSILLGIPEAAVAQPYPVVVGSVAGAGVGTILSLFSHGDVMAIVAAVIAFGLVNLIHAYHPPGVALAMYPLLLRPGPWFPLAVVLPFTVATVGSAAVLSRMVKSWHAYPKELK